MRFKWTKIFLIGIGATLLLFGAFANGWQTDNFLMPLRWALVGIGGFIAATGIIRLFN